jgi:hypothetical protein
VLFIEYSANHKSAPALIVMFRTAILNYPLKAIRWFREDIYKNSPEKRMEAEKAIKKFYDTNKPTWNDEGSPRQLSSE